MVKLIVSLLLWVPQANALLGRTQSDMQAVTDRLEYEFGAESERKITPILVAPPQPYWQESKLDFGTAMMNVLSQVFSEPGELISCAPCYQSSVYVTNDGRTIVQNGELSLGDLSRLRANPAYAQAKSVLMSRETPSGIEVRVVAVDDGRILYTGLIDSTEDLKHVERPMRLAREMDRRKRGEALSYVNIDLGVYPQGMVQLKFLEQWGNRNQHLSGFVISALNPTGAFGVTYMYMTPWRRQATIGLTGYYSLKNMFETKSTKPEKALVGQIGINYAISGAYGIFAAATTDGTISVGVSFLNPVFFPFLL